MAAVPDHYISFKDAFPAIGRRVIVLYNEWGNPFRTGRYEWMSEGNVGFKDDRKPKKFSVNPGIPDWWYYLEEGEVP